MPHKILLCDDEIHILRAAEFKFKRAGYEVRIANDGLEAYELIQEEQPDVLISDYQMPRMDGLQLTEKLRQDPATEQLPIILLTAKGIELKQTELAKKWDIKALLAKPFSPRELLSYVEQIVTTGSCDVPATTI